MLSHTGAQTTKKARSRKNMGHATNVGQDATQSQQRNITARAMTPLRHQHTQTQPGYTCYIITHIHVIHRKQDRTEKHSRGNPTLCPHTRRNSEPSNQIQQPKAFGITRAPLKLLQHGVAGLHLIATAGHTDLDPISADLDVIGPNRKQITQVSPIRRFERIPNDWVNRETR